jgi:Uma2 family endonuclease
MAEQTVTRPAGEIVAEPVSVEEYLERYAADHYEWVRGALVKMSPISGKHDDLTGYLSMWLAAYLALNPIGRVRRAPFVMRLDPIEAIREPDLQVILNDNPGQFTETAMIGPADICIEVVSPESVARDYGKKLEEYEQGGVGEYWIIDPARQMATFYRMQATRLYASVQPDADGFYRAPRLPKLALHVPTLWQDELPGFFAIGETVRGMLVDETERK